MPKVSVIIPIYNVEKYLRECLDSVVNQTLKDIEIICINDGSTDNSLAILEEYASKDSRIILLNQENQGQGVARNNGIKISKGEYTAFIDPDDWVELDYLEIAYKSFLDKKVDIIQFDQTICKENGEKKRTIHFNKFIKKYFKVTFYNNDIFDWQFLNINDFSKLPLSAWDKMYSTEFLKRNKIFFAFNKRAEDHIFSISSTLLAARILYFSKAFYNYRYRKGSSVNVESDENFCIFENIQLLKEFLNKKNLYSTCYQAFTAYTINTLTMHYECIPTNSRITFLSKCKEILDEKDYKKLLKKINGDYSFLEKIFSIKNKKEAGIIYKVIVVLGFKFKFIFEKRKRYDK